MRRITQRLGLKETRISMALVRRIYSTTSSSMLTRPRHQNRLLHASCVDMGSQLLRAARGAVYPYSNTAVLGRAVRGYVFTVQEFGEYVGG